MALLVTVLSVALLGVATWLAARHAWARRQGRWVLLSFGVALLAVYHTFILYEALVFDLALPMTGALADLVEGAVVLACCYVLQRDIPPLAEQQELRATQVWIRLGLVVGVCTVVSAWVVGNMAFRAARESVMDGARRGSLDIARLLSAETNEVPMGKDRDEVIQELVDAWNSAQRGDHDCELLIAHRDGTVLLATVESEAEGPVGPDHRFAPVGGADWGGFESMLEEEPDGSGRIQLPGGEEQVAGFAYCARLNSVIVVHRSKATLDAAIHSTALPWGLAVGLVVMLLLPLSLGLLHRAYESARQSITRTRTALEASERILHTVVDGAPLVLFATDRDGVFTLSEGRGLQTLGNRPGEVVGRSVFEVYRNVPRITENIRRALSGEEFTDTVDFDGMSWETIYIPIRGPEGSVTGVIGVANDVSRRRRAERALRQSEERYALAVQGANDGLWDWDLSSSELYLSPRWKRLLGYEEADLGKRPTAWFDLVQPEDRASLHVHIQAHLQGKTPHLEHEHRLRHKDGSYRWVLCRGLAVRDEKGAAVRMVGSLTDINERKQTEEDLLQGALYDGLTDLPNRALLVDRISSGLARVRRGIDPGLAVLLLDLDDFKLVNDSLGHGFGDQLLVGMARRLQTCVRPGDTVARLGGDEFVLLLEAVEDSEDAVQAANRVHQALSRPFHLSSREVFATASIGIAVAADEVMDVEDLLRQADTAMYRAKAEGHGRHAVFDDTMHTRAVARLQLETDLRRAVEREEFLTYYQPVVDLKSGQISGFEALMRWKHPENGIILPDRFIPVAEETGLIDRMGLWILEDACRQMSSWQKQYADQHLGVISVNISKSQLAREDLLESIHRVLSATGLSPRCLLLEVTESVFLANPEMASHTLQRLRERGIQVCIDDFGTGYSSLGALRDLPVDSLKIDRSFVGRLHTWQKEGDVLKALMALGRALGKRVIAEGVETTEQLGRLRELECEQAQGFLFSPPVDRETAEGLIQSQLRW